MEPRYQTLIDRLNDADRGVRLASLGQLMDAVKAGEIARPAAGDDVNNHIHTTYSFSPYSPTRAIWEAYRAGLCSAGIMDHDSICGAREFIQAGNIAGIATTIGIECRVDFSNTPFAGMTINNPDQRGSAYVALHGFPHMRIDETIAFFKPYIRARVKRIGLMVERINAILGKYGIVLDFEKDVVPLSQLNDGGTVTERHLLFAAASRLIGVFGKGTRLLQFIRQQLGLPVTAKVAALLTDEQNHFYTYDLLGVLKSDFIASCWIDASEECPTVNEIVAFARRCSCICAYPYLGDVAQSATGDKRPQRFEDAYLDALVAFIKKAGFGAISYMPTRNTPAQLARIMALCSQFDFLQISGEDINSPRQLFTCETMRQGSLRHLVDATWALIGHERAATLNEECSFFSPKIIEKYPDLSKRIRFFKEIGMSSDAAATC